MLVISAPAKIILLGEHAVVYGVPAIAIPVFGLQSRVEVIPWQDKFLLEAVDTGERLTFSSTQHPLIYAVISTLASINQPLPNVRLRVESEIPMASGLGSGASLTAAIVRSLYKYFGVGIDYANINDLVYDVEKRYHGTPSGIDNTVVVYQKPIYFTKNKPFEEIDSSNLFTFLIADTGVPASTREMVGRVKSLYENRPQHTQSTFDHIHSLVITGREALRNGDAEMLGDAMTQNHQHLRNLQVSTPKLDELVQIALSSGAYGAKLSGGGGGGNVIALSSTEKVESIRDALLTAGARQVYETTL